MTWLREFGTRRLGPILLACIGVGCQEAPPRRGEVVVVIDTDVAVPELASSMRIDIYGRDQHWLESREVFLGNTDAWPTSFSLMNQDDATVVEALLRVRVFPEGATRVYRGEGSDSLAPWKPPRPADSLEALCEDVADLPIGGTVTLRRGREAVLPTWNAFNGSAECQLYGNVVGSVAARVTIATPGRYDFAVVDTSPTATSELSSHLPQVTLELRRDCDDHTSGIACTHGMYVLAGGSIEVHAARVAADLEPGTYHLVTGGVATYNGVTDITLAAWSNDVPIYSNLQVTPPAEDPVGPWLRGDPEATPTHEPDPLLTIDRLVMVSIEPHQFRRGRVVLRGGCLGRAAKLADAPGQVVIDEARGCIDGEELDVVPDALAEIADVPASVQSSFAVGETCGDDAGDPRFVCVPSGAFALGSRDGYDESALNSPPRGAALHRFWIDRTELTVADYRSDVAAGLDLAAVDRPTENPTTPTAPSEVLDPNQLCTWSTDPLGREELPLTCIPWYGARAWCRFRGGDLPTSAQWEYAALRAGHATKAPLPWGHEPPRCSCEEGDVTCRAAVFERHPFDEKQGCIASGFGPAPAAAIGGPQGDESPLGIIGLAGNVREWTLDSALPLDHPCFQGAVWDPVCDETFATARVQRGGSFVTRAIPSTTTYFWQPAKQPYDTGVRCVYGERPL